MATVELAVALPAVVLVVVAGMTAVSVLTAQLRCVDAAREAARAAARGESVAVVHSLATRVGPPGAVLTVAGDASEVTVTVTAESGVARGLPSFRVTAVAVALREPERTGVP